MRGCLAGALLVLQDLGAAVPVVDLALEPGLDLALDLVDLGEAPGAHLLHLARHQMLDGVADHPALEVPGEPWLLEPRCDRRALGLARRPVVEVGRGAGIAQGAVLEQLDEVELPGDDLVTAVAVGAAVLDRLVEGDEDAQAVALIARIDQDRALLHQIAVALEGEVDGGVEQRVAGADEGGDRGPGDMGLVEADALVAREDRRAGADLAVALAQSARARG